MKTKKVPFDINKAKSGAKVVTDDGNPVKILEYNKRLQNGGTVIVALVDMGSYDDIYHFKHDGVGFPYNLCIEEEEEVKPCRMTYKELSKWLRECPNEFRECKNIHTGNIFSTMAYKENQANTTVDDYILVRRNYGKWEEPLIDNYINMSK